MSEPGEIEQLTVWCRKLGASDAQAATMAAQLLKRAAQLSRERGITQAEALAGLLEIVAKGRKGEVPAKFAPPRAPQP
jgi:hypothetical protein